jgi:hypothetical protein
MISEVLLGWIVIATTGVVVAFPDAGTDGRAVSPDVAGKAVLLATIRARIAVTWRFVFLQVIGIVGGHRLFLLLALIE